MRSKLTTPSRRQIVDQGNVTKMITTTPINTMGLIGVTEVGDKKQADSPRLKHTEHLLNSLAIIPDVLQHFVAEDDIKGIVEERQCLRCAIDEVRRGGVRLASPLQVIFETNNRPGIGSQVLEVHPNPTAILPHATCQMAA